MKRFIALALMLLVIAVGCSTAATPEPTPTPTPAPTVQGTKYEDRQLIRIAALKGPTGIGMAKLMEDNSQKQTLNRYEFTLANSPDQITGKLISGEFDIAAVPTNVAALLYNKTAGKVQMLALNTLGVLYILENGNEIESVSDLAHKQLVTSGQGATPEYILDHILEHNGIDSENDIDIQFLPDHSALAAQMIDGSIKLGMLPEPFVTNVITKNPDVRVALDVTEEWANLPAGDGKLVMGCIVVQAQFAKDHPQAVKDFLTECNASVDYVNHNIDQAAQLVEKHDIMAGVEVIKKAIPNCNIVFIDGEEMRLTVTDMIEVLFEANAASIGGKLPDENFYYYQK